MPIDPKEKLLIKAFLLQFADDSLLKKMEKSNFITVEEHSLIIKSMDTARKVLEFFLNRAVEKEKLLEKELAEILIKEAK
jgi:hypothetical protein